MLSTFKVTIQQSKDFKWILESPFMVIGNFVYLEIFLPSLARKTYFNKKNQQEMKAGRVAGPY